MDRLTGMKVFAAVARLGSFVAAADELGISNAMCSKYIRNLESSLGQFNNDSGFAFKLL